VLQIIDLTTPCTPPSSTKVHLPPSQHAIIFEDILPTPHHHRDPQKVERQKPPSPESTSEQCLMYISDTITKQQKKSKRNCKTSHAVTPLKCNINPVGLLPQLNSIVTTSKKTMSRVPYVRLVTEIKATVILGMIEIVASNVNVGGTKHAQV